MLSHPLLHEVRKVIEGHSSLRGLECWLLSHLQSILSAGDQEVIGLANELDAMFVDIGENLISEEECREQLTVIVKREDSTVRVSVGTPQIRISGQRTIRKRAEAPRQLLTLHQEIRSV